MMRENSMRNKIKSVEEIVEEFAELEHERWSKWQRVSYRRCKDLDPEELKAFQSELDQPIS